MDIEILSILEVCDGSILEYKSIITENLSL